ncbi:MAG: hypothetical protein LRZ85_01330 [Alphaproteobacteria bacterium]|nr:hypothetical protein [Alphaproteobacteria bacterium]
MPQRRHFLLSGLAMVLLSTSALGGHALAQKGESMDPVSGWSSTSVPNKGNSSYCAVARRFNGNVILTLARNMRDETSIALDFDTASFEKGNVFRISLDPGAGEQRSMTVKPTSEKAFVLKLGKDESFYRALLKTGFLRTEIGEKGYNFNLSDIDTGKENLTTCLSQIGAPEVAAASAPTAAPASAPAVVASVPPPATPDPKLAELSQRLAALESENRRLQRTPAAVDPLKSPMTPELPLERVALKPLNDVIEVAPVPAPVAKAPAPVMAAAKPAPAPVFKAPEVASSGNVAKVDQSLIVSMAEENRRLKAQLEDASHAAAPAGIPEEEVAHLNQRLKKLESENKALTRQLDSMETDLALANSSPEISDKDAKTIADLRAENNRLIASLATIQTAAGDDEPDAFAPSASSASAREAERKLSILENQNRVLTRRLDTLLGQNGDYSRQLARYEMQVEELEKQLADSKVSPGPDYAAMVDDLKQEIAAMQAENESLRAENAKPDYALQQQLAELQVENEVLNKEIKKAESEIFVLKEEKSRPDPAMEGEIAALKAENDMLSKEISQARSEIFVLKEQKSKPDPALEGQISALKTENQLLNRQIMDVQAENIALKAQPEGPDYSEMVEQLKAEIAAVQSENMELKEIRATTDPELEGEIAALKTENDLLNLEISRQAELARAEYEDKLESMKVENEVLQERLAGYLSSQDSIMALKNEMEGIKAEKDELSLTMADIQAQAAKLAELETVAHEREEQIALLQGTLDSLEQENVELRRMSIDERAEDSRWRLIWPLMKRK